ncbi:active regulator of SIRT1 [Pelodytes ibericus]
MSASLLRKGLDLLVSDVSDKKTKSKSGAGTNQNVLLTTQKTGVRKQLKRLKRQGLQQKEKATAKGRVIKSAVDEFKKNSSTQDHLVQNLKYMLDSHKVANEQIVTKILKHSRGRKARDQEVNRQKKPEQKSVFSEKDFKQFEKEYFGQT